MTLTHDAHIMASLGLEEGFSKTPEGKDDIFYYSTRIKETSKKVPILVLIHGYPQSWRHVIKYLPANIPLFIPDIPGYGRSAALKIPHNKRNVGLKILSTLENLLAKSADIEPQQILLCGHDRGARICQRLATDSPSILNFDIVGTILLDIVPTLVQWKSFSEASSAINAFHWPLLANVDLATSMILALGDGKWVRGCIERWSGSNEAGLQSLNSDESMSIYEHWFYHEPVVRSSCDDYRAGAEEDVEQEIQDQAEGRKIDCDVLVLYSSEYLGARYDVEQVWREWIGDRSLECVGIDDDIGHFMAEESPEKTAGAILRFYRKHV